MGGEGKKREKDRKAKERGCWESSLEIDKKNPTCPFNIIHLPVLFFLFLETCAFQNVLLYLGRCDIVGSSNYLGLSKVVVPKSKTNFYKITFILTNLKSNSYH